jgi:hypothetical protein
LRFTHSLAIRLGTFDGAHTQAGCFDLAVDKGTADTLLFRSKRKEKCGMLER